MKSYNKCNSFFVPLEIILKLDVFPGGKDLKINSGSVGRWYPTWDNCFVVCLGAGQGLRHPGTNGFDLIPKRHS